jgi:hypothetical protein
MCPACLLLLDGADRAGHGDGGGRPGGGARGGAVPAGARGRGWPRQVPRAGRVLALYARERALLDEIDALDEKIETAKLGRGYTLASLYERQKAPLVASLRAMPLVRRGGAGGGGGGGGGASGAGSGAGAGAGVVSRLFLTIGAGFLQFR